jgi:excisionase family DNA binding protein
MSATKDFAREIAEIVAEELGKNGARKELYTVEESCHFLGCSRDQISKMQADGRLRAVRIDSRPRFRIRDLERLVERSLE